MSHIGKKTIFFSPLVQIHKSKNFLLIGTTVNSEGTEAKIGLTKFKISIPLKLTMLTSVPSVTEGTEVTITRNCDLKKKEKWNQISLSVSLVSHKCLWGTLRALLAKTISGFYKKHTIKLKFIGVGFKANLKKNLLILRLGFSHKLFCQIPNTVAITKIKKRPVIFLLQSHFLEIVKTTAFRLRSFKKPELYKGKGILLVNEALKLKEGKKISKS